MVILDNSTRWNSIYQSIHRGNKLKLRIQIFCSDFRDELGDDILLEEDWSHLADIESGLVHFHQATKRLEGKAGDQTHGVIWESLPILEALLQKMERGLERQQDSDKKKKAKTPSALTVAYQNAWAKLNKYYGLTDKAHHIYAAGTILNPSLRFQYFEDHWNIDPLTSMKSLMVKNVTEYWEKEYPIEVQPQQQEDELDILDEFLKESTTIEGSQFRHYMLGTRTEFAKKDDEALLSWWNSCPFHDVKQMAFDILSIPATSAEMERVFSIAKRMVADDRYRMTDETMEVTMMLTYWWKKGLIKPGM
jgi:hypothetical protein